MKKENKSRPPKKKGILKKALGLLLGTVTVCLMTGIICLSALIIYAVNYGKTVSKETFTELARAQDRTTHLYYISAGSSDSGEVATELEDQALYSSQNREWVRLENTPENLKNAFIAIEDHRFREHKGIDIRRTLGALLGYIKGNASYGGSTITQQLIKNVTGNDEYSVSRKLHEMILALKLDGELTKDEILELYLNTIYLSDSCYGIGSAAEHYFDKECRDLTLDECAALACIPQSPSKWNPRTNPRNNKARRSAVLSRMSELGYATEEDVAVAKNSTLQISRGNSREDGQGSEKIYSWYTEAVIDEAIELLTAKKIATTKQAATKLLYSGGLSVITAQNPEMQRAAEEYFKQNKNFQAIDGSLIQPECSTVVIDPKNGNILALVGGRGEKKGNRILNYATATKRSPGSSIKPISVYAPAIDQGKITYGSVIDDTPYRFISGSGGTLRPWPQNSPRGYRGLTTVRDAVSRSVNTVSVKILNQMDKNEIFHLLHDRLGMSDLVEKREIGGKNFTDIADSPLAHGQLTVGVTVKEMTGAYTALSNDGVYHRPKTVLKIFDSEGKLLVDNTDQGERIFSSETAAITTKLLQGVTKNGTASSITLKKNTPCAGKTGTTHANHDKWFIGYTPDLLCGVWFGYATPKDLAGFSNPQLKVWDGLMNALSDEAVLGHAPGRSFTENPNIVTATYCRDSGKRVTAACLADIRGGRVETGYFTKDTVPKEYCDCHVLVRYDTVNHGVAGPDCPHANCKTVGMIRVKREFPIEVTVADTQYVYRDIGNTPPCLSSHDAFYLSVLPKGVFAGRSSTDSPFNRFCHKCYFDARAPRPEVSDKAGNADHDPSGKDPTAYED